jgi:hypothetical protein
LLAAALSFFASALQAQAVASLGAGASIVEYDGFLISGAVALTPAVQFDTPKFSVGGQGNWTIFESGNQIFQATGAAGWLTPLHPRWHLELTGSGGVSKYADEQGVGHVLGRSRLHFFGESYGAWLGGTAGAAYDSTTVSPVELTAGAWVIHQRVTLMGIITGAWLEDDRHLDIAAAARWTAKRVELEARLGMRPWTESSGGVGEALRGVWAEMSALLPVTTNISFTVSGGKYPSDPVRRVLGASYVTAGLRIATARTEPLPALTNPAPIIAAARLRKTSTSLTPARLEITASGSLHTIRVHAANANSVEVMGDFTDWQPVQLSIARDGIWEIQRELKLGVHRLNVRIDGGDWFVPEGAREEQDEFGGVVGIIVVR